MRSVHLHSIWKVWSFLVCNITSELLCDCSHWSGRNHQYISRSCHCLERKLCSGEVFHSLSGQVILARAQAWISSNTKHSCYIVSERLDEYKWTWQYTKCSKNSGFFKKKTLLWLSEGCTKFNFLKTLVRPEMINCVDNVKASLFSSELPIIFKILRFQIYSDYNFGLPNTSFCFQIFLIQCLKSFELNMKLRIKIWILRRSQSGSWKFGILCDFKIPLSFYLPFARLQVLAGIPEANSFYTADIVLLYLLLFSTESFPSEILHFSFWFSRIGLHLLIWNVIKNFFKEKLNKSLKLEIFHFKIIASYLMFLNIVPEFYVAVLYLWQWM